MDNKSFSEKWKNLSKEQRKEYIKNKWKSLPLWKKIGIILFVVIILGIIGKYNNNSTEENYEWNQKCCCEWKDPTFGYTKAVTSVWSCKNFGGTYTTDITKCY